MEINANSSRMYSLIVLYDMQTTYFRNVLEGITDSDAHKRLETRANHVAWLAGSLVQQRFEIGELLGLSEKSQAHALFAANKGIQDGVTYPSLDVFRKDWDTITPLLRDKLMSVDDARLDEEFEMMPEYKMSHYDLICFMIYREANCIGQIALWRRLLGYEPMRYM